METTLQLAAWGGSIALRIPKNFLKQMNLTEKSTVKIKINDNNELIMESVFRHKTIAERFKDWDGVPYEMTEEDIAWLEMPDVGSEIIE